MFAEPMLSVLVESLVIVNCALAACVPPANEVCVPNDRQLGSSVLPSWIQTSKFRTCAGGLAEPAGTSTISTSAGASNNNALRTTLITDPVTNSSLVSGRMPSQHPDAMARPRARHRSHPLFGGL